MAVSRSQNCDLCVFPSELVGAPDGAKLGVAGRLVADNGTWWVIADALASCNVSLSKKQPVALGAWVEVRGRYARADASLRDASVVAIHHGTRVPNGQFARFSTVGPHLERRARAKRAVREFFEHRGYLEVDTNVRVAAPGTDVYLEPQPCGSGWLITSPEFAHKRLLAGGFPRIFEFARCTRRHEVGAWHQPEFTMLEWYRLLQPFDGLLQETESLVVHLANALERHREVNVNGRVVRLDDGFERLTVADAFLEFADVRDVVSLAAEDEDRYFQLMVDKVDPGVAEIAKPTFLTHYPLSQAALAAPSSQVPGCAERFELFIGGVELCNGYGELTCAQTQRERFLDDVAKRRQRGLPDLPVDEGLLSAMDEGIPPCSGNAIGFDRLLAVLLQEPLEQVMAFPVILLD